MQFAYVVQGFGEWAQAESFALYARGRGDENVFVTDDRGLEKAMRETGFPVHLAETPQQTRALIRGLNPEVLFHCNSKTVHKDPVSLMKEPPLDPQPFSSCFDSNWLWLKDERSPFRAPDWLDLIFVVMPEPVFNQGLQENGGHYKISEVYRDKIFNPGFIPSGHKVGKAQREKVREKLGIKEEKLIFSYFGTRQELIIDNYIRHLEEIAPSLNIKVFIKLAERLELPKYEWLITEDWLTMDEMIEYPAASDLVIQHHGLGTLPKIIRNQVPVLCITPPLEGEYPYYRHSPYFEIEAFRKLGLCHSITYDFSADALKEAVASLLFDGSVVSAMKQAHATYFEEGEAGAYAKLVEELKKRK